MALNFVPDQLRRWILMLREFGVLSDWLSLQLQTLENMTETEGYLVAFEWYLIFTQLIQGLYPLIKLNS